MNSRINLPKVPILLGRYDFILAACTGKKVLHLGCVDTGLYEQRYQTQELLHSKLKSVTSDLWGVDIDGQGLDFLRDKGFTQLIQADVSSIDQIVALNDHVFDVILAAELIEHLLNPGLFLEAVKKLLTPGKTTLIITLPNAFRITTLLGLLDNVEIVHPDHNYWFSYATAMNILEKTGYYIKEIATYSFTTSQVLPSALQVKHKKPRSLAYDQTSPSQKSAGNIYQRSRRFIKSLPRRMLTRYLFSRSSFWGDGIILVCELPDKAKS